VENGWDRLAGRVGLVRVALSSLSGAAAAALQLASPAFASGPAQGPNVDLLRSPGCPPTYKAVDQGLPTEAVQREAMKGNFRINRYTSPVHLQQPVFWKMDPFRSRQWQNGLQSLKWLDKLYFIYSRSTLFSRAEKLAALAKARDYVLDWIDGATNPNRGLPKQAWVDKTVGDRTPYIAYVARAAACEGILNDVQSFTMIQFLQFHGNRLHSTKRYSPSNRGLFEDLGLYLLAEYCPFLKGAPKWRRITLPRFRHTFHGRLDEREGVWNEHSPGYHLLVIRTVERFAALTGHNVNQLRFLPRMRQALGWMLMPDGRLPQFGDTYRDRAPEWAVRYASGKQGIRVLKRSGYAFVKQAGSYLGITSQFHNTDHKHADDLSFELFEDGQRVISDTGVFDKDIGAYRRFERRSEAHNVFTVDGQSFKTKPRRLYGSGITAHGQGRGWYAIEGVNPLVRNLRVHHRRLFLYKPGTALIVVDRVRAASHHTYRRYFHFGPGIDVGTMKRGVMLRDRNRPPAHATLGALSTSKGGAPHLTRGQDNPLQGWEFPDFRKRTPRWSSSFETRGRNADYVTTISLNPAAPISAGLHGKVGKVARVQLRAGGKKAGRLVVRRGRKLRIR
jgi:Heparinase II/III-like protein/Heparinase II/III N-terminus